MTKPGPPGLRDEKPGDDVGGRCPEAHPGYSGKRRGLRIDLHDDTPGPMGEKGKRGGRVDHGARAHHQADLGGLGSGDGGVQRHRLQGLAEPDDVRPEQAVAFGAAGKGILAGGVNRTPMSSAEPTCDAADPEEGAVELQRERPL